MSKKISLEQLPPQIESLLEVALKEHESIVFEHEGSKVAAVVPMDEYIRLHPEIKKAETKTQDRLSYELPEHLLSAYHRLLDKKFSSGLTASEEAELEKLDKQLDEAELATPLVQSIITKSTHRHKRWMRTLNEVITKLRELRELS